MTGLETYLVFYACYFHYTQHKVLCLTLTASSSAGLPSPGPPAEVQSKPSSAPPHHSYIHSFVANELGSERGAPDSPSVSE